MKIHLRATAIGLAVICLGWQSSRGQEPMPNAPSKSLPPPAVAASTEPLIDPLITVAAQEVASPAETPIEAEAFAHPLEELAWMVGDWLDQDEDATIETSVNWTKNGSFLTRSFRVASKNDDSLSGMQLIGWDPAQKTIRSWTYDSDGGFGEEIWNRSGERWTIRAKYTLPSGQKASATNVLRRIDDDTFGWRSVNRVVAGELKPDIDEVIVARKTGDPITETAIPNEEVAQDAEAVPVAESDSPTTETAPAAEPPTPEAETPNTEPKPDGETAPGNDDGGISR